MPVKKTRNMILERAVALPGPLSNVCPSYGAPAKGMKAGARGNASTGGVAKLVCVTVIFLPAPPRGSPTAPAGRG